MSEVDVSGEDGSPDALSPEIASADTSIAGTILSFSLASVITDVHFPAFPCIIQSCLYALCLLLSLAADGSFVQTTQPQESSEGGIDQQLGVNKDVRSPFIISAITNQHGKQVYRVGYGSFFCPEPIVDFQRLM